VVQNNKLVPLSAVRPGDIILCRSDGGKLSRKITAATRSEYSHAAICIGENLAAESIFWPGVAKVELTVLVGRYNYVAILRHPKDVWTDRRINELRKFIDKKTLFPFRALYNLFGLFGFDRRKERHELTVLEKLKNFFEGTGSPRNPEKKTYFCSELVCSCYNAVGIFQPSAAVAYDPLTIAPGDLGKDPSFGYFFGYCSARNDCRIPGDDEFYDAPTKRNIRQGSITSGLRRTRDVPLTHSVSQPGMGQSCLTNNRPK